MKGWLLGLGAKAYGWLAAIGALLGVLALVFVAALRKGEAVGRAKGDAEIADVKQKQAAADTAAVQQAEAVDETISKQADAGTQKVGTAAPDTPAGQLRERGWVRDDKG